ncbi:pheromone binding [Homalodisca vitripennis]|nr:pheromone binding [Homalodisca vitripennis]
MCAGSREVKHTGTMKSFAVIAVVLVAVTLSQAGINRQESIDMLEECKAETGAKEDSVQTFDTQTIPESKEGKCMMACVLRKKGLMKDGKMSGPDVTKHMEEMYADDPNKMEEAARVVGMCSTIDVKGLDECEMAYTYMKCGQKHKFKL